MTFGDPTAYSDAVSTIAPLTTNSSGDGFWKGCSCHGNFIEGSRRKGVSNFLKRNCESFRISQSLYSMEIGSSPSTFRFQPAVQPLIRTSTTFSTCCRRNRRVFAQGFSVSYGKFVDFALEETRRNTHLIPSPLQEKFSSINSKDGKGVLHMVSFQAAKIRLLRSLTIETETMQVLDFAVFPKVEYDLPIFCANFFTSGRSSIVLLDLNPLHDIINQHDYKENYIGA